VCYLPVRRSGRTRSQRTHGDAELEDEREEYTAGTHPFFAPRNFFEERRRKVLLPL